MCQGCRWHLRRSLGPPLHLQMRGFRYQEHQAPEEGYAHTTAVDFRRQRRKSAPFLLGCGYRCCEGLEGWLVPSFHQSMDLVTQPDTVTDTFSLPLSTLDSSLAIRSSRLEQQSLSSAALAEPKLRA